MRVVRGFTFLLAGIVLLVGATAIGSGTGVAEEGVVAGPGTELTEPNEQQFLETMREVANDFGLETREHAFIMYREGTRYIVFTDQEPKDGIATVTGTIIEPGEWAEKTGFVFANNVSFTTEGEEGALSELNRNPKQYEGQLVEVTSTYFQISYTMGMGGRYVKSKTDGFIQKNRQGDLPRPGMAARFAALNFSTDDDGATRLVETLRMSGGGEVFPLDVTDTRWWIHDRAEVEVLVLPGEETPWYYIVGVEPVSTERSVSAVASGKVKTGEVVTVEAQYFGAQVSAKQALLKSARCAPDSVTNPVTGCMPIVADVSVHTGALFTGTPTNKSDVLWVAGVSNQKQREFVTQEQGTYRVTGRVVSTSQIHPALPDGQALLVYGMERQGSPSLGIEAQKRVENWVADSQGLLVEQMQTGEASALESEAETKEKQGKAEFTLVSASMSPKKVGPSEATTITIVAKNTGSATGTASAGFAKTGVWTRTREITLDPGEKQTLTFNFDPDMSPGSGHRINARLNGGAGGIGTLKVVNTEPADLSVASVDPPQGPLQAGEEYAVSITVKNSGGKAGKIDLNLAAGDQVVASKTVRVAGREEKRVMLTFEAPENQQVGLSVNGEQYATLETEGGSGFSLLVPQIPDWATSVAGGISVVFGVASILTSGVYAVFRRIKLWQGGEPNTTEQNLNRLLAYGLALTAGGWGISGVAFNMFIAVVGVSAVSGLVVWIFYRLA